MRKKFLIWTMIAVLFLSLFSFGGCGKKEKEEQSYQVFYLNMEATKIAPVSIDIEDDVSPDEALGKLIDALYVSPDKTELRPTLTESIKVNNYSLNTYLISVDFSKEYYDMTPTEEILVRAAIVRTLCQVEGGKYCIFSVDGEPLLSSSGAVVGSMGIDSFVENPGAAINSTDEKNLTLYFANEDGTMLVKETRTVHYSTNVSLEKLVVEQLIEGPMNKNLQATIPSATKIISVSVMDGICYVNFDTNFENQNLEIAEQVVLFSIVNSLIELPTVSKVQISINGDSSGKCRFNYDLSKLYEYESDVVYFENQEEAPTEETPTEEIPTDETPIEERPAEEISTEDGMIVDGQNTPIIQNDVDLKIENTEGQ